MADLIRARAEIECVIADFKHAGETGKQRREAMSEELETLEGRIADSTAKLDELRADLDDRIAEEKQAKEA
jgi:structural maintenance of chromosome 3 (chondroitin sulfate proteoglycan 6)